MKLPVATVAVFLASGAAFAQDAATAALLGQYLATREEGIEACFAGFPEPDTDLRDAVFRGPKGPRW